MKKHSLVIAGHKTSLSLEPEFWQALHDIAHLRKTSVAALIADIDNTRTGNLSSAVRVFILREYQQK